MNKRWIGLAIAIGLLVVLYFLNRGEVTVAKQDGFEIRPIAENGYELKSVIHFNNPNLLSSTIKGIREEFRVNGVLVGILDMGLEQGIPGRKESEFPIGIRFDMGSLLSRITIDSANTDLQVEVEGEVTYSNFIGSGSTHVQQSGTLSLPR